MLDLIIEDEVLPTTFRPSGKTTIASIKSWITTTAQSPKDQLLSRVEEGFGCPVVAIKMPR